MKSALFMTLAAAADDSFITCTSNNDCPNGPGMFNGTCCGRTDFIRGDPYRLGGDWQMTVDFQNNNP